MSRSPSFLKWTDIEQLHNLVKTMVACQKYKEEHGDGFKPFNIALTTPIRFRGKVKLHGQNGAVTLEEEGAVMGVQSRTQFVDKGKLGQIIYKAEDYWRQLFQNDENYKKLTIFGEFAGGSIQRGVALSKLKNMIFAVFAIRIDDNLIIEPDQIRELMGKSEIPENVHILPWHTEEIELDFQEEKDLADKAEVINSVVAEIEKEDPWVKEIFGESGTGEGLVLYPVSLAGDDGVISEELFSSFVWKAKGEKHRVIKTKKSASVKPAVAEGVMEFVELVLPEARMNQGVENVGLEKKKTGLFIKWIWNDIQKECKDELEASGLTWKAVQGQIKRKASTWYSEKIKNC